LIEIRSIGGLSGSPVILTIDFGDRTRHSLIGVCSGHYDLPLAQRDDANHAHSFDDGTAVNMGLAYVQPARELIEILNTDTLIQMRTPPKPSA